MFALCSWNVEMQWDMLLHRLDKNKIFTMELPTTLDGLIDLAIRVDAQLQHGDQRPLQILVPEMDNHSSDTSIDMICVSFLIQSPCRWTELFFLRRKRRDAGLMDYVYIVRKWDTLLLSAQ